jgi:hypothetical protein
MLRTKLHVLANTRNRRSTTVCSQLILGRGIKRTVNFHQDLRHLSIGRKSDGRKLDPGNEASTSESELLGTAIDPRKNNEPNVETVTLQQPQYSSSESHTSTEKQSTVVDLNNVESKKLQLVKIEHDVMHSKPITASSVADGSCRITDVTLKKGISSISEPFETTKCHLNPEDFATDNLTYLLQK